MNDSFAQGLPDDTKQLLMYCCDTGALRAAATILHREPQMIRKLSNDKLKFAVISCMIFHEETIPSLLDKVPHMWNSLKAFFDDPMKRSWTMDLVKSLQGRLATNNFSSCEDEPAQISLEPDCEGESDEPNECNPAKSPSRKMEMIQPMQSKPPKRIYQTKKNKESRTRHEGEINGVLKASIRFSFRH